MSNLKPTTTLTGWSCSFCSAALRFEGEKSECLGCGRRSVDFPGEQLRGQLGVLGGRPRVRPMAPREWQRNFLPVRLLEGDHWTTQWRWVQTLYYAPDWGQCPHAFEMGEERWCECDEWQRDQCGVDI